MRISDWSSDVCSSDLDPAMRLPDYPVLHPRFRWMRDYLSRVAPPGGLPGRQAVDPTVFKALLPFINLVDVIRRPDGLDFRFRLVGTLQTSVAGREITGRHVEEAVLPQFVDRIRANMKIGRAHV